MADSSDEYFTFNCNACLLDGDCRQAVDYCRTCKEYLCQGCLKIHNKLAMTREHSDKLIGNQVFVDMTKSRCDMSPGTDTPNDDSTFSCTACATGGVYRQPVDFCQECSEYFCDICLQNHKRWTNHSGRLFGTRDVQNMINARKSGAKQETGQTETDPERLQSLATGSADADEMDAARALWEQTLGNEYQIVEADIPRIDGFHGLGFTVFDGKEQYINEIACCGPVAVNGVLRSGDIPLEANGKRLYGETHDHIVRILKGVGKHVHLVCARRIDAKQCAANDDNMPRASWEQKFGKEYQIVEACISKFDGFYGLGCTIVDDKHQYINDIVRGGPVAVSGVLRSGDILLEANGKRLYGETHDHIVNILKGIVKHVHLVCARRINAKQNVSSDDTSPRYIRYQANTEQKNAGWRQSTDVSCAEPTSTSTPLSILLKQCAGWSRDTVVVEIDKTNKGLGFSVVDYPDPCNAGKTAVVVSSFMVGGPAHRDGRIKVGDKLVSINDVDVENGTMREIVMILKAIRRGLVKLGISKPVYSTEVSP